MIKGICTLANDLVSDQLIALLNSIEAILGKDFPVCIYPYDHQIEKITKIIANRPQVEIYCNSDSMAKWDRFAQRVWDSHPFAFQRWQKAGSQGYHRFGTHRRYCAFDAPFDQFLYMDADTLLLDNPRLIFEQLEQHNCVVYDFQFKDLTHVYEVNSPKLTQVFAPERLKQEIFCSGFFASKKDEFSQTQLEELIAHLQEGEAEILYPMAPDQTLINYLMMRGGKSIYNLALNLPPEQKTGNSVTSSHFQEKNHLLYDKGVRLIYLHYIGVPSKVFTRLCSGENLDLPYRDIFLYYRYLHQPETRPNFTGKPKPYNPPPTFMEKVSKKLGFTK